DCAMQIPITLTQSQLMTFLLNVALVRPVFIWGAPGIGKSSLVEQFAADVGLPCVSLLGCQLAPEDLLGVPQVVDGVSRFSPLAPGAPGPAPAVPLPGCWTPPTPGRIPSGPGGRESGSPCRRRGPGICGAARSPRLATRSPRQRPRRRLPAAARPRMPSNSRP